MLAVDKDHRKKGIGSALVQLAIDLMIQDGGQEVYCSNFGISNFKLFYIWLKSLFVLKVIFKREFMFHNYFAE